MHDKGHPSGTFPTSGTKSPDKLLLFLHRVIISGGQASISAQKAKLSTSDGPSSQLEIGTLYAQ